MKLSFLFGAGVSIKSGIPGIGDITEEILNGNDFGEHTDGNFYQGFSKNVYLERIQTWCIWIKQLIDDFYCKKEDNHITNYEDIFYIIDQIKNSESYEFENPALFPLLLKIESEKKKIFGCDLNNEQISKLIDASLSYIHCVVWQKINKRIVYSDQFSTLKRVIDEGIANSINICSLNHDLVIEDFLRKNNLEFTDGFKLDGKLGFWDESIFISESETTHLLKLHGSIDWFLVQDKESREHLCKLPADAEPNCIYRIDPRMEYSTLNRPLILIGTFNKILNYSYGLWEFLFQKFKEQLIETEYLIVSGYSFGDKGINIRIVDWLRLPISKKILIIHPSFESLSQKARGAYHISINPEQPSPWKNPKLATIEKKFEDVSLAEIKEKLEI